MTDLDNILKELDEALDVLNNSLDQHNQNAGEWKQCSTTNGKIYYYNTKTKQTSWVQPEGFFSNNQPTPKMNSPQQITQTPTQPPPQQNFPSSGGFGEPSNSLEEQPWYFGKISLSEAETILRSSKKNTFLVRDSTQPDRYFCSKLDISSKEIRHILILKAGNGYYFQG